MADESAPGRQGRDHVFGLQAFVALHHGKLDALTFYQNAVAFAADRTKVHEDIFASIAGDEAEPCLLYTSDAADE